MNKKWDELEEKIAHIECRSYDYDDEKVCKKCWSYYRKNCKNRAKEVIKTCMDALCDDVEKEIEKLKCEGLNDGQAIHNTALLQVQQTINKLRQG